MAKNLFNFFDKISPKTLRAGPGKKIFWGIFFISQILLRLKIGYIEKKRKNNIEIFKKKTLIKTPGGIPTISKSRYILANPTKYRLQKVKETVKS